MAVYLKPKEIEQQLVDLSELLRDKALVSHEVDAAATAVESALLSFRKADKEVLDSVYPGVAPKEEKVTPNKKPQDLSHI